MPETTVGEDTEFATLVDLLEDEHVRTILAATSTESLSASELGERCDVSESTIYRRIDRLRAESLVAEQTRPRADGHHETVYVATLDRFEVELDDDGFAVSITRRADDMIDQLTRMWEGF
jgi:predicted transcriptional regulator